jgi:hypothetical protein
MALVVAVVVVVVVVVHHSLLLGAAARCGDYVSVFLLPWPLMMAAL